MNVKTPVRKTCENRLRMNILVTGADGQLGSELRNIADSGAVSHRFIFTDVSGKEGSRTEYLDITDADAVRKKAMDCNADVIVNCAAYTNVDRAEDDPKTAALLNCTGPENLASAALCCGAVLIHISTDYVFGGDACVPYREDCPAAPESVYGETKLAGEKAVAASGCRYIIIRTAWLYSPYGKNFMKTMLDLTSRRDSLNVVFDQTGSPTYAADLASAIVHIIDKGLLDRCGIYHYSNEGVCSWYDFAVAIRDLSGNGPGTATGHCCRISPCHSEEFPSRVRRPHYSVLDKSLVKETFGLEVPYWMDSLKDCITRMSPCPPEPAPCHPTSALCHPERSEGSEAEPVSCHPASTLCHPERSEGSEI